MLAFARMFVSTLKKNSLSPYASVSVTLACFLTFLALLKSCATNGKLKISDYEASYYNFDSSVKQHGSVRISDLACLHVRFAGIARLAL